MRRSRKDRGIRLWDQQGRAVRTLDGHGDGVWAIAFGPDGKEVVTAGEDYTIKRWSRKGELIQTIEGHDSWVVDVEFSPDGELLASASRDNSIRLWDRDGNLLRTLSGYVDIWNIAFSPDGRLLAFSDRAGGVVLWRLDQSGSLEELMAQGCARARNFLRHNAAVPDHDRGTCDNHSEEN